MLFSTLFIVPFVPRANAAGIVCLAPDAQTTCPASPQLFTGAVGSTVRVGVVISGSGMINGFDISIIADRNLIAATGADLTGSVLGSGSTILLECIDGVIISGNACSTTTDGPGVLHFAAATAPGVKVSGNGILFTAVYKVTGSTTGTPIDYQTGCTGTSSGSSCVTITDGSGTPVAVALQGGTFGNLQDFTIDASPNPVQVSPGATTTSTLTLNSEGGYADLVNLAITAMDLPASVNPSQVDLASFTTNTATLSVGPAAAGVYHVTVTATGSGIFMPSLTPTHAVTVEVDVHSADFALSSSTSSLTIPHGSSDSSTTLTVTPVTGFTGTVALSAVGSNPAITGSASPSSITASGTSALTVSVAFSLSPGSYSITVTGTGPSTSHSVIIGVIVPGPFFTVKAVPAAITAPRTGAATTQLTISSINNFQGTVSLSGVLTSSSTDGNGVAPGFTLTPSSVTLSPGGVLTSLFESDSFSTTATGNYTFTLTATSGSLTPVTLTILVNIIDFVLGPSFCPGSTIVYTTPNGNNPTVSVGPQCNTLLITTQTGAQGGAPGTLFQQINSLSGLASNGVAGTGFIGAFNPDLPSRGTSVPELGFKVCLLKTFFANGTQIPYSFLKANGPIVRAGGFNGCRFDGATAPNDLAGGFAGVLDPPAPQGPFSNPDFFVITAEALSHTPAGTYTFQMCAQSGILIHCRTYTLVVIQPPFIHQFTMPTTVSFSGSGGAANGKVGISSPSTGGSGFPTFVQLTLSGIGSSGHTFSVSTAVFKTNPGGNINNIAISIPLTRSMIGETFTYSSTILVGLTADGLTGTSTVLTVSATLTVTA